MFWAFRRCFSYELRSIGSKFVCLNGLDTEVAKALACKVASFGYGSVTKETRGKVVVGYFAVVVAVIVVTVFVGWNMLLL